MPISSFPISVNASVNLSSINIDGDLDMGVNSILGYAKSTDLKEFKLIPLSSYCFDEENQYFAEELISTAGVPYTVVKTITPTITIPSSPFGVYASVDIGEWKNTYNGSCGNYFCLSLNNNTDNSENVFTTASVNGVFYNTYTNINSMLIGLRDDIIANNNALYLKIGINQASALGYLQNYNVKFGKYLIPSTDFTITDLGFTPEGIILNGGTFKINGVSIGADNLTGKYSFTKLSATDVLQFTGNVNLLVGV